MTLKIEITIPGCDETLNEEALQRSVAKDVLAWIHSDDSGLAGVPDTTVRVNGGYRWAMDFNQTGEVIL